MTAKPKVNSEGQNELEKAEQQFKQFDDSIKALTVDQMAHTPKEDVEPQTKLAQKDIDRSKEIYLKPVRSIGCRAKFNERFREKYNFDKEYVHFIAENKQVIGESIELWTKPYPGIPAEEWKVPVNKPVWGPRYLAEQIKSKSYHRLKTENRPTTSEGGMMYYGDMVVDTTVQRLDAYPVSTRRSIFMGSNSF